MKTHMEHVLLFWLMSTVSPAPVVSGFSSTMTRLGQTAILSCKWECPGSVEWLMVRNPGRDVVVARCDGTSCTSEEGFTLSHDQYTEGNLSLSVSAADYRKRGWYTCQCDHEDVCHVSLRIEPVEMLKQIHPGDQLVLDIEIPERVEVWLNRSLGDDDDGGGQRSVPVCSVDGRNLRCESGYEKRVMLTCSVSLTVVKECDRGVYTVWDMDNHEIISTHTLTLTGNVTEVNNTPKKGTLDPWNMKRIFEEEFRGLVVGVVMCGLLCVMVMQGWYVVWTVLGKRKCSKVRTCYTRERDHNTQEVNSGPETIKLQGDE